MAKFPKVRMPLGRTADYRPEHPERTAVRALPGIFGEYEYQTWPNRASMARTIRMQEKAGTAGRWRACIALRETEGY